MEAMHALLYENILQCKALRTNAPNYGSCIAISKNLDTLCHLIDMDSVSIGELNALRKLNEDVFNGRFRTTYSSMYHTAVMNAIAMAQDYYKSQL